jgi:hypothetical protein
MSRWNNHLEGLLVLKDNLEVLQSDKSGFRYRHDPERLNVSPARLTLLKNLVEHLSKSHHVFAPFVEAVNKDYLSPETSPATFEQSLYSELHATIVEQVRTVSAQDQGAAGQPLGGSALPP